MVEKPKDQDRQRSGDNKPILEPGTLWPKVLNRSKRATRRGTLQHIPTRREFIPHAQVNFLVRIVDGLTLKNNAIEAAKKEQTPQKDFINPFLPYEPDLFVSDLSETHIAILNKFNVVDHHLLIITRSFERQISLLTLSDFKAMWICLNEFDGLAFYNSGPASGSSQPHKHLQLIPLPMVSGETRIPAEALITGGLEDDAVANSSGLPFAHSVTRIPSSSSRSMYSAASYTLKRYLSMLRITGLHKEGTCNTQVNNPYNLLITREWMLLVPRREECFESISINALGFAGALLVRSDRQMQILRNAGPMKLLQHVTRPR